MDAVQGNRFARTLGLANLTSDGLSMRVVASQVDLSASTAVARSTAEAVKGEFWVGDRAATDSVRVSAEAKQSARLAPASGALLDSGYRNAEDAHGAKDVESDEELLASPGGARLVVLRRLLEKMTGKKIHVGREEAAESSTVVQTSSGNSAQPPSPTASSSSSSNGNARVGWGLQVDLQRTETETNSVGFSARGTIVTEDGTTIAFNASFVAQSTSVVVKHISLREGDAQMKDPLVLLFSGSSAELTRSTQGFDLDANGTLEQLPSIANGAYVVDDVNKNGKVDNGSELLGALSGDGFADLRAMDEDGNGFLDSGDAKYQELRLWQPRQDSGGQLLTLADAGVLALFTGSVATPVNLQLQSGDVAGRVRATGIYLAEQGTVQPLEQIDLKV